MNTVRIVCGRLLEIDVASGYRKAEDVDEVMQKLSVVFSALPKGRRVVVVADWRQCQVFMPEVQVRVHAMLARDNTLIERSCILHSRTQATSVLQVMRLVKEAEHPSRRIVTSPEEVIAWLTPTLDQGEARRLREFLNATRPHPRLSYD